MNFDLATISSNREERRRGHGSDTVSKLEFLDMLVLKKIIHVKLDRLENTRGVNRRRNQLCCSYSCRYGGDHAKQTQMPSCSSSYVRNDTRREV